MQGDVTNIVTMSSTERRKIIDELAGVAEFDKRIEQATEELNSVGEQIEHQKIVLAEIISRLDILKADRDQALKYLELKGQKEDLERSLVFSRAKEVEAKLSQELLELDDLATKEQRLIASIADFESKLLKLRSEIGNLTEEIRDKGGNEQLLLRQELDNLRGELTREDNKLTNLQAVVAEKTKLHKSLQAQIKTIEKHQTELAKQKRNSQEDLQAVELVLMEKQGALSAVEAEIEVLRQEKDRSSDVATSIHTDLQELRDKKHSFEVRKTELATRRQGLERELEVIRNSATALIEKSASFKGIVQGLEKSYQDSQADVAGVERTIRQLEAETESTRQDIEQARQDLETVNRRLIEMETAAEVAGESGYGRAVEAVLDSGITGVHGTVGQLGQVEEHYALALETAIGNRLAFIVVEDDEVAEQCIAFLKKNQAGRATFIPLNKILAQAPGILPQRQGVIDFAYNLINFDPRFGKAFQHVCRQTIVVENMDTARRLINQERLVTLQGELFEKSGTISGGYDTRARMRFSHKANTDTSVLKGKAKILLQDISDLQNSLKDLIGSLNEEQGRLGDARAQVAHKGAELEVKRQQAQNLDKEIDDAKPRLRLTGDEIEKLDQEIVHITQAVEDLDHQIGSLHNKLTQTTGNGSRTAIEKFIAESEELHLDIENVEKNLMQSQREMDRVETEERLEQNNLVNLEQQLATLTTEIEELNALTPSHSKTICDLKETIACVEQKVEDLSDELKQLRDLKDKLHDEVTASEVEKTKRTEEHTYLIQEKEKLKLICQDRDGQLIQLKDKVSEILESNPQYVPPSQATVAQLISQVDRLEKRMRAMEPVNMKALEEFSQADKRRNELDDNLNTLALERQEIVQRIAGYDELKKNTFLEAFRAINHNFQEVFAELSHGHGRLELENPENPFGGGLIIRAQPRDKKMQRIEALSGGEKSLTALSFVFAFQRYAPAPFYAFDEVDMMLDGSNAERLAQMVRRQSTSAQFVVVSLRRPMIENADHAIGVSLRPDGYSRVVGIQEVRLPELQAQGA
ncbi:MAG: chromosome segregation protein SMC, partial [Candidatus Melainabacteria bacterium]|nr:chromosome segregation protein SMC [Candidatus Melainabacteria bacterium]